jgi:hypothetical protein
MQLRARFEFRNFARKDSSIQIHALFIRCRWIVLSHFRRLSNQPSCTMFDGHEAELLRDIV